MSKIDRGPRDMHPKGWNFLVLAVLIGLAFCGILAFVTVCFLTSLICGTRKPGDDYDLRRALRNAGLA